MALLNAAAAICLTDLAADMPTGLALAREAVESGSARRTLEALIVLSWQPA